MEEQKKKVLVTDDDATLGKTLIGCLEEFGYEAVFVDSKDEAIARLGEIKPDVVTTDLMSPKLDGFENNRLLKESDSSIPVIVLFGNLQAKYDINGEKAKKALRLGAFDCLEKPFDVTHLRQAIERALKTRRSKAES